MRAQGQAKSLAAVRRGVDGAGVLVGQRQVGHAKTSLHIADDEALETFRSVTSRRKSEPLDVDVDESFHHNRS